MSLRRKVIFNSKSELECCESTVSFRNVGDSERTRVECENGPSSPSEEGAPPAGSPGGTVPQEPSQQNVTNGHKFEASSKTNGSASGNKPKVNKKESGFSRSTALRTWTSFAIPEGLAMDPLAPAPLAVSTEFMERIGSGLSLLRDHGKKVHKYVWKNRRFDILRRSWKSIVNIVLVDAKDLPYGPSQGTNGLYCKFKLGNESHKSKQVPKTKPTWCERFNLYHYDNNNLEVTVWHKGKQKNFMGRCVIDISKLDREKTHELWQELECGYGTLHLLVTLSATARGVPHDSVPTTHAHHPAAVPDEKYNWFSLGDGWSEVGRMSVTVYGARGLRSVTGKPNSYCVLELDNARVQTHTEIDSTDPNWNKSFTFSVNDITSTLDIFVHDDSFINTCVGKISIPLLRIVNDEKRWYALKNGSKTSSARGNCPRILLEMSIAWNPIKASLRVMTPKETKYVQDTAKFDIPLIYNNLKFIKDIFHVIHVGNEHYKVLFEWDNRERSAVALAAWIGFWFYFKAWMAPIMILVAFLYHWTKRTGCSNALVPVYISDEDISDDDLDTSKDDITIKGRLNELKDLTFTTKNSIDYIVALIERIKNLVTFRVPYLSYLAMIILSALSLVVYYIPINYLFMALGLYKFTRKLLDPERVPNNDLLDFLSRVPDDIQLDWSFVGETYGEVGRMTVMVIRACGLRSVLGRPDTNCVLELENVRVQTHTVTNTFDPEWNETFKFSINDITSTLNVFVNNVSFMHVCVGKLSIPLLRINNHKKRWYVLKNRSKKSIAKGKCPRIQMEITIAWSPITASLRVISPKETLNVRKRRIFSIPLIYSNLKVIKDVFHFIKVANEHYKAMFEWEERSRSTSAAALAAWICFWSFFKTWMVPVMILILFLYRWSKRAEDSEELFHEISDGDDSDDDGYYTSKHISMRTRLLEIRELSFMTKNDIDYTVALFGRIKNLVMFRVPYLSYLAMLFLTGVTCVAYFFSYNDIFIALGVYKYTRKLLNPERVPNNDLLDFLSRVPEYKQLREWHELRVAEPSQTQLGSLVMSRQSR